MSSRAQRGICSSALLLAALLPLSAARAEWIRDANSIAWSQNGVVAWRFSFDPKSGKPYFHPLTVGTGTSFTNFKPEDHPWHYGLWFSWKYINRVNYWEEDRTSGRASGSTRWSPPVIDARPNGSATITLDLTYSRPTGEIDLTERRVLEISAPAPNGAITIDWDMRFKAGKDGAELDRTPMPGEPNGAVNGGYAGLSVRLAAFPLMMSVMSTEGPITDFKSDRARPSAAAVAGNFTDDGKDVGGIAIISDAANITERAPWYIINAARDMRFICAAVLAPAIRKIEPGGEWRLRYRIAARRTAWSKDDLDRAVGDWNRTRTSNAAPGQTVDYTKDIARIAHQEATLQFSQFDAATAWAIGSAIRNLAESRRQAVAIDIEVNGLPMFFSGMPGASLDNVDWIRRKKNVATRFRKSSYGVALDVRQAKTTLMDRQALPVRDYAAAGGCFPILLKGTGMIGTITVSGLPERSDHELVVEIIAKHLGIPYESVSLPPPA